MIVEGVNDHPVTVTSTTRAEVELSTEEELEELADVDSTDDDELSLAEVLLSLGEEASELELVELS